MYHDIPEKYRPVADAYISGVDEGLRRAGTEVELGRRAIKAIHMALVAEGSWCPRWGIPSDGPYKDREVLLAIRDEFRAIVNEKPDVS